MIFITIKRNIYIGFSTNIDMRGSDNNLVKAVIFTVIITLVIIGAIVGGYFLYQNYSDLSGIRDHLRNPDQKFPAVMDPRQKLRH